MSKTHLAFVSHRWLALSLAAFAAAAFLPASLQAARKNPVPQNGKTESPTLSRAEAAAYLAVRAQVLNVPAIHIDGVDTRAGLPARARYPLNEIEAYVADQVKASKSESGDDLAKASGYQGSKTFPWLRLRRSFSDVLTAEDPSLAGGGKEKFDDIQGALFSYERDLKNHTETWSAQASLLAPFSFYRPYNPRTGDGFGLQRWGFIPSVSLNKLTTSGNASSELEEFTYRIGAFAKLRSGHDALLALTARAYFSYLTDDVTDKSITAGEFEIEPTSYFGPKFQIGSRTVLWRKEITDDITDDAWIAYQLRLMLHGEFGSVEKDGPAFAGAEYNFFRLGPKVQLDLNPLIFRNLSVSLKYEYLPALSGHNPNDSLFQIDAEWILHEDEAALRRVTLKASYVDGGLELSKEKVRTFRVGLGVAF
jgi:hypothetical protein